MKDQLKTLKLLNIFAFAAMIAVNVLAQALPLGGYTTAEISAFYPTLLTPAGITFSIWMVIYVLTGWFVIQQTVTQNDDATEKMGWMFAVTCALNIAWIVSWHYRFMLLATVTIAALWVCLLRLSRIADHQQWFIRAAFSIYYAWITVATAAQLFIYLSVIIPSVHLRMPAVSITVSALLILTGVALLKLINSGDVFFGLTMAWSVTGVFISHLGPGYNKMYPGIIALSAIAAAVLFILSCWTGYRMLRPKKAEAVGADIG